MKSIASIVVGVLFTMTESTGAEEGQGVIGRVYEDGVPVIYKFVNEMPADYLRNQLTWLTVISWKYDGSSNNGMPREADNGRMLALEETVEKSIERDGALRHVYSRTGNNLKELVYYARDREQFLEELNEALAGHPRYPIEINFYSDAEWADFHRLLSDFSNAAGE